MIKNLQRLVTSLLYILICTQPSWALANDVIRVGFVFDMSEEMTDSERDTLIEQLNNAIEQSNQLTYNPLGIELQVSFEMFENTHIQRIGFKPSEIVSQARSFTHSIVSIMDDTKTDVIFFVLPTLGGVCGSAEIPHLVEHFDYRFLVGTIKNSCVNADVLSHEMGHLFGAHHDEEHDSNRYIIKEDARGCILDGTENKQGSLMSYASERSASFSTPEYCGTDYHDNEQLIREKAPLLASMYERHTGNFEVGASPDSTIQLDTEASNDTNSGDQGVNEGSSGGGSIDFVLMFAAMFLLGIKNRRIIFHTFLETR